MKKEIIVTPLYYILEDALSKALYERRVKEEDFVLVIYDDVSPMPSIQERYAALMATFNLPVDTFSDLHDIVFPDVDSRFDEEIDKIIKEYSKDGDVVVHFFPTEEITKDWADFTYNDFIIDDLAKSWDSLKERMNPNFVGRFARTWEHYMFGLKGHLDKECSNVVYYGEFKVDGSDNPYPIFIGVRDYASPYLFSGIKKDIGLIDFIGDLKESTKDEVDRFGLEIEEVLEFASSSDASIPYGYDIIVKLTDSPRNLKAMEDIMNRRIDIRLDSSKDYLVHTPTSPKSYPSVWFERLVKDAKS